MLIVDGVQGFKDGRINSHYVRHAVGDGMGSSSMPSKDKLRIDWDAVDRDMKTLLRKHFDKHPEDLKKIRRSKK